MNEVKKLKKTNSLFRDIMMLDIKTKYTVEARLSGQKMLQIYLPTYICCTFQQSEH